MKNFLPPNIRLVAPYIVMIIAIVILGIFTFKFSLAQVSAQNQKIKQGKEERNTLTQKEAILSSVQENILPAADLTLSIVPSTNSSLVALSQIKVLASEKGLVISNVNIGSGANDEKALKASSVNFDLDGDAPAIIDFANSLNSVAPLMHLDGMTLQNDAGLSKANMTVKTYWAPLPTSIPGVTDGVSSLTQGELDSLNMFTSLRLPSFSSLAPEDSVARSDPFN